MPKSLFIGGALPHATVRIRDVVVEHCDVGFGMTGAKSTTIRNTRITGRATYHPYVMACALTTRVGVKRC